MIIQRYIMINMRYHGWAEKTKAVVIKQNVVSTRIVAQVLDQASFKKQRESSTKKGESKYGIVLPRMQATSVSALSVVDGPQICAVISVEIESLYVRRILKPLRTL